MTIKQRRCTRCGQYFEPPKANYYHCESCFRETQSVGFTQVHQRAGAAAHRHGGISRLRTQQRTILLVAGTRERVVAGFDLLLQDLYGSQMRLMTLLQSDELNDADMERLMQPDHLDNFIMRFCPQVREWFCQRLGTNVADVLIEYYGLYGDARVSIEEIAKQ